MILFLWSCSDAGKDPLSSGDETNCTQDIDCNSVCGGSAVVDACGVCEGDDSTCTGCMDENANNYDNTATISCNDDNGDSAPDCCAYGVDIAGCTNSGACNFNAEATLDNDTCWTPTDGCACIDVQGAVVDDCGICEGDNSTCVNFSTEIMPLFSSCTGCHGDSGGLSLSTYTSLMTSGNSGAVVTPGDGSGSRLVKKLRGTASGDRMPQGGVFWNDTDINLIETWINEGALNN